MASTLDQGPHSQGELTIMNAKTKTVEPDDAWDEREVGADEQFVEVAPDINMELDTALDLHPISIRLQKSLVDNLKALAHLHGLGYQPLIRQILTRWVDSEVKQMVVKKVNANAAEAKAKPKDEVKHSAPPQPRQKRAA